MVLIKMLGVYVFFVLRFFLGNVWMLMWEEEIKQYSDLEFVKKSGVDCQVSIWINYSKIWLYWMCFC